MTSQLIDLEYALTVAPVMGQFHPLVPLCLSQSVERVSDPYTLLEELDSPTPHSVRSVIIPHLDTKYVDRFLTLNLLESPPAQLININLPNRIETARQWLLTNHRVADRIIADVQQHGYDTVILLLVDGLSYADVAHWPERPEPCFIDGPSITYSRTSTDQVDPQVGFPAIINSPPLARRLVEVGIRHQRGYSYWSRAQNDITETLFAGIPLEKVNGFDEAYEKISQLSQIKGLYIQIVREGLDGLAHSRREISDVEVKAATEAIHQDLRLLVSFLSKRETHGAVYLIADHGILWKNQHAWQEINYLNANRPRYTTQISPHSNLTSTFSTDRQTFSLLHYPYLGRSIRANDSGVHGGLSYWESIVPFIHLEVAAGVTA